MILDIVTFPAESLRNRAVEIDEITPEIKQLIDDMRDTLLAEEGFGLAAPQVGKSLRLILVDQNAGRNGKTSKVYINPVLTHKEGEIIADEGCLSVPGEYAPVKRYMTVHVTALDEFGNEFSEVATEQLARILQHETDHLEGILFIDHLPAFRRDTIKKHIKRRINSGDYVVLEK